MLFLTEMWERYSYYGMRALLIFYLTQHFKFADAPATLYYGAYTSLVYAFSILGGYLADRVVGQFRSVQTGGTLILCGHLLLALEGELGDPTPMSQQLFFLALGLIIAGTGFFKPCISTMVGSLYAEGDNRRQTGFFIFYVGINLGSALAALSVGYLGQTYGWSYGFGAAALGMAFGLIVVNVRSDDLAPHSLPPTRPGMGLGGVAGLMVGLAALGWVLVQNPTIVGYSLLAIVCIALGILALFVVREASARERANIAVIVLLFLAVSVYWSAFEQAGSSLNLFAARLVSMDVGFMTMQPSQTQFFNASFILLLTPVFALVWRFLARHGVEPSVGFKFSLGLAFAGLAFTSLVISLKAAGAGNLVGMQWLALYYVLQTCGELCISPIGLSAMTQLAPRKLSALVMGLWFMGASAGNYLASLIATLTARSGEAGAVVDAAAEAARYGDVFGNIALYAFSAALLFGLVGLPISRMVAKPATA